MDEFDLIRRYFAPLAENFAGAFSLADDAAVIDVPSGMQLVATKDAISEGVHFLGDEDPALIAQKLLRVNLSDLAAKGAAPLAYLLAVALPPEAGEAFIARFALGLKEDQALFNITLCGGDSIAVQSGMVFSLTALGLVPQGKMLRRNGAKPADLLCMSGTLGDAALGLRVLRNTLSGLTQPHRESLAQRYFLPQPRLSLGQSLRALATACMDISDGLAQDAGHLAAASGCALEIEAARLPFSPAAQSALQQQPELLPQLIGGGDDYELLFTLPETALEQAQALDTPITIIGRVTDGSGVRILDAQGHDMPLPHKGYQHFK